jgi:hypothetical protein
MPAITAATAQMRTDGNQGREKNYEPNSFGGPQQTGKPLWAPIEVAGLTGNHAPVHHRDDTTSFRPALSTAS